jgi:hypothetical protein
MQVRFHSSIRCKIEGTVNIRRCAGTWGGAWTKRERCYLTVMAVSKRTWQQQWRTPTIDFVGLAALTGEDEREVEEDGEGFLYPRLGIDYCRK